MSGTGVLIYKLSHLCEVSRTALQIGKLDSSLPRVLKEPQQWTNALLPHSLYACQLIDCRRQLVPGLSLTGFSAQYLLEKG